MKTYAPRLHVLIARNADYAVVIRRGPSKHVCTVGWDMKTNEFTLGQWLKGRIYERRCDLSPDGNYMVYFAMNGHWESEAKGSYTAISRTPYLKAIGLWPKGDCWHGGGVFVSNTCYWLNDPYGVSEVLKKPIELRRVKKCPFRHKYGGECSGLYYPRLMRDGWTLNGQADEITVFEKPLLDHWILKKTAHATVEHPVGKDCYFDEHELINTLTDATLTLPHWEWADTKNQKLYWAEHGKLYTGLLDQHGFRSVNELYDLNDMRFEAIEAPY